MLFFVLLKSCMKHLCSKSFFLFKFFKYYFRGEVGGYCNQPLCRVFATLLVFVCATNCLCLCLSSSEKGLNVLFFNGRARL